MIFRNYDRNPIILSSEAIFNNIIPMHSYAQGLCLNVSAFACVSRSSIFSLTDTTFLAPLYHRKKPILALNANCVQDLEEIDSACVQRLDHRDSFKIAETQICVWKVFDYRAFPSLKMTVICIKHFFDLMHRQV